MSRLQPPKISYSSTTTANATANAAPLNEITQSQSNARAAGTLPPQHGTKRPGAEYREHSGPFPQGGNNVDSVSRAVTVQPDAKRKPYPSQGAEFKATKGGAIPKPTSIAAGFKGTSIANLVSFGGCLCSACSISNGFPNVRHVPRRILLRRLVATLDGSQDFTSTRGSGSTSFGVQDPLTVALIPGCSSISSS
jgi:hypothetical protein